MFTLESSKTMNETKEERDNAWRNTDFRRVIDIIEAIL